ncbi:MAG: ATP-binding protein [Proteobacteria bacterium]|nr:ATP-binding protein [Pseudomonadota bacterium]
MILAIASGKGGTGKTTVSASLASVWPGPALAVDLDVEEPNLHLFLHPEIAGAEKAYMEVPLADESKCTTCGACSEICQFKAISLLGDVLITFPEMCHGCGACLEVCPAGALTPDRRELGEVSWGQAGKIGFLMGKLRVGEAMSPPLMRSVRGKMAQMQAQSGADVIVDCPPGVSCPAVNAVMGSDMILLVTEPTPFGLYDVRLAHQAFAPMNKPMAAVINRAGLGDDGVRQYCRRHNLPILAEIPFDRQVAQAYSQGQVVAQASPAMKVAFEDLAAQIRCLASGDAEAEKEAHHA